MHINYLNLIKIKFAINMPNKIKAPKKGAFILIIE